MVSCWSFYVFWCFLEINVLSYFLSYLLFFYYFFYLLLFIYLLLPQWWCGVSRLLAEFFVSQCCVFVVVLEAAMVWGGGVGVGTWELWWGSCGRVFDFICGGLL
jgi:hypothetical protein